MKGESINIRAYLDEYLKKISQPFIDEFGDAERYLISQYLGEIKQFTIDQLQEYDYVLDMDNFNWETPGATSYHYSTLLEVLVPDSRDYECISVFADIANRWNEEITKQNKRLRGVSPPFPSV